MTEEELRNEELKEDGMLCRLWATIRANGLNSSPGLEAQKDIENYIEDLRYASTKSMKNYDQLIGVAAERERQDLKWGIQRHSWVEWMSILAEEVGEAATEANKAHWYGEGNNQNDIFGLREELVQVAAVAVAIIEHIDEHFDQLRKSKTEQ